MARLPPISAGVLIRLGIALAVGLAEPSIELAWKCREGFQTSEACVWGRSYLPLSRALGLLIITPVVFGVLTLVSHLRKRGRSDP